MQGMIETYILENLAAFADCGTLLKSAERLNVTQPAITRSFKKLEDELEVPLFDRTKNSISLNQNGTLAARYARKILSLHAEMKDELKKLYERTKTISFGSIAPAPMLRMTQLLKQNYASSRIHFELFDSNGPLLAALKKGTFSFVILNQFPPDQEFFAAEFFSEHLKVSLPNGHHLALRSSLRLADLAGETFIMFSDLGFWAKVKRDMIPGAHFITQNDLNDVRKIAAASTLPAFVTDISQESPLFPRLAETDRTVIPLLDDEVNVTYWIVCGFERKNQIADLLRAGTKPKGAGDD